MCSSNLLKSPFSAKLSSIRCTFTSQGPTNAKMPKLNCTFAVGFGMRVAVTLVRRRATAIALRRQHSHRAQPRLLRHGAEVGLLRRERHPSIEWPQLAIPMEWRLTVHQRMPSPQTGKQAYGYSRRSLAGPVDSPGTSAAGSLTLFATGRFSSKAKTFSTASLPMSSSLWRIWVKA